MTGVKRRPIRRILICTGLLVLLGGVISFIQTRSLIAALATFVGLVVTVISGLLPRLLDDGASHAAAVRHLAGSGSSFWAAPPSRFGAHPAVEDVPYVVRDVQPRATQHLIEHGRILLSGPSMAGKTRLAFEILRSRFRRHTMLQLRDGSSLSELIARREIQNSIIFLDDLERYLRSGLLLRDLLDASAQSEVVVVATIRDREALSLQPTGDVKPGGWDVLAWFRDHEFAVPARWSSRELARVDSTSLIPAEVRRQARLVGLSQYLGGMPLLLDRIEKASHDDVAWAVMRISVDWRSIGMPAQVPDAALHELLPHYAGFAPTETQISDAIETLITAVAPGIYAIRRDQHGIAASEPVVDAVPVSEPPEPIWKAALAHAPAAELMAVGYTAYAYGQPDAAISLWDRAARAGDLEAMNNLGVLLSELDPPELTQAEAWFLGAAEAEVPVAMYNLGRLYEEQLEPPKLADARVWLERAAQLGLAPAMTRLGVLELGSDEPDRSRARALFQQAAGQGESGGMFNLAQMLMEESPPHLDDAVRWYQRAAEIDGSPVAMYNTGAALTQKDPPEHEAAAEWFERAANEGHNGAALALLQTLRKLDPPQPERMEKWLKRASDAGFPGVETSLVTMELELDPHIRSTATRWIKAAAAIGYAPGGVFGDPRELFSGVSPELLQRSLRSYEREALAGDVDAMYSLGLLLLGQSQPAYDEAERWFHRAAVAGDPRSMYNLATLLTMEPDSDVDGARVWLESAADSGHVGAMHRLGLVLATELDKPDPETARAWFERSAAAGNTESMNAIGVILASPPIRDLAAARPWFEKAAAAGLLEAKSNLGRLHLDLDPPEPGAARRWFTEVADTGDPEAAVELALVLMSRQPAEYDEARRWLEPAANKGNLDAMHLLGASLAAIEPPELDSAENWLERATRAGHAGAAQALEMLREMRQDSRGTG